MRSWPLLWAGLELRGWRGRSQLRRAPLTVRGQVTVWPVWQPLQANKSGAHVPFPVRCSPELPCGQAVQAGLRAAGLRGPEPMSPPLMARDTWEDHRVGRNAA